VVLPYSRTERLDFSGVLATALGFGRAIVLSDVGGLGEVAAQGAARLVAPDDAAALRAALVELIEDPGARERLEAGARAAARGPYSWDVASRQTLAGLGSPARQADYLALFRADSIVADAELIRPQVTGGAPWAVLGQSFGGFCTVTYLSKAPSGVSEAFITGGLPGLTASADEVYRITYQKVAAKCREHYQRYPGDIEQARRVAELLAGSPATLPGGGTLTVQRFQALGQMLGASTGSHTLHYLLEDPFAGTELSDAFLHQAGELLSYASAPLYALVHEACYAQGGATRWSAQRIRAEFPEFSAEAALSAGEPVLFTGEMVYPWVLEHDPALRPLAQAGELLAEREDWPALYDPGQLARNCVPAAAAVYFDDMYVPRELSVPTAAAIAGLRPWVTNEYEHDGLRVSNGGVLDRLIALARGEA